MIVTAVVEVFVCSYYLIDILSAPDANVISSVGFLPDDHNLLRGFKILVFPNMNKVRRRVVFNVLAFKLTIHCIQTINMVDIQFSKLFVNTQFYYFNY